MSLEQIYARLPRFLQAVALNLKGWDTRRSRFNGDFSLLLNDYIQRGCWSAADVRAFRNHRLWEFLCWAERRSPFYAERFRQACFSPIQQGNTDGFDQVPLLEKEIVQDNIHNIAIDLGVPTRHVHTSGTTGGGLRFPCTWSSYREQWACWQRYRQWHGIDVDEPCAYFGGRSIVPITQRKPPFWRNNRMGKQLIFSAYHLSSTTAEFYISALQRSAMRWIHGYPSFVALLASYLAERSQRYEVRWVTLGAENVTPAQQTVIETAFGVRPIQHYGMAEAVANFSQWPDGVMRVDEDFAFAEFLPRTDGRHDVVGTNFTNLAFPLIRYRVGDQVELPDQAHDDDRFGRVVLQVDGRLEDFVVTKDGARLGRLDHIFKDCVNVREAQIVQQRNGEVRILIVPNARFTARDQSLLQSELRQRFGDRVDFCICRVDSIERTPRGKLKFVVSEASSS